MDQVRKPLSLKQRGTIHTWELKSSSQEIIEKQHTSRMQCR